MRADHELLPLFSHSVARATASLWALSVSTLSPAMYVIPFDFFTAPATQRTRNLQRVVSWSILTFTTAPGAASGGGDTLAAGRLRVDPASTPSASGIDLARSRLADMCRKSVKMSAAEPAFSVGSGATTGATACDALLSQTMESGAPSVIISGSAMWESGRGVDDLGLASAIIGKVLALATAAAMRAALACVIARAPASLVGGGTAFLCRWGRHQ